MNKLYLFIFLTLFVCGNAAAQFSQTNISEWQIARLQREVEPFYRKPTKKELKTVEPHRQLIVKYAEFLRQSETGLTKLIPDKGCAESTRVINVSEECLKYSMPGAGSSFSFRTENYRIPRLADITYTDNGFQSSGALIHALFVNLGDVPLDEVTPETKGMKYLIDFQPEPNFEKSKEVADRLMEGITQDGFLYRRGLYTVENTTFALRSIAYGGKSMRSVKGLTYNELDFDKRRDVIVIFRIVEKENDGSITILWKKLQEKDSPEIKKEKRETMEFTD